MKKCRNCGEMKYRKDTNAKRPSWGCVRCEGRKSALQSKCVRARRMPLLSRVAS